MEWIFSLTTTLAVFIAAIFILVTVHELGHFLAAKFFNMRVDRFSIGFPPNIFGFKKGETEYVIGATPLGGYVKIAGMIDESMDDEFVDKEPQPDEFRSKPVWQRMIVITAGVIFNAILAVIIYAGIAFSYGENVIPVESVDGVYVAEESLAAELGFQTGDRLVGVNGERVEYFNQLFSPSSLTGRNLTFMVERNGETVNIATPVDFLDRLQNEEFLDPSSTIPSKIYTIVEGGAAEQAGLEAGDKVVRVDGEEVSFWVQLVHKIQQADGPLDLVVQRNGEELSLSVNPDPETNMMGLADLLRKMFLIYKPWNMDLPNLSVRDMPIQKIHFLELSKGLVNWYPAIYQSGRTLVVPLLLQTLPGKPLMQEAGLGFGILPLS